MTVLSIPFSAVNNNLSYMNIRILSQLYVFCKVYLSVFAMDIQDMMGHTHTIRALTDGEVIF